MPKAARLHDTEDSASSGTIVSGCSSTVLINGLPAAIVGASVSAHEPSGSGHDAASIVVGSATVLCDGQALARVGDALDCGHTLLVGSPDVEVG